MRIGELSAKAGVNVQTIRFYEREKLLRKPVRTPSGYRIFAEADLERVRFIKQSQQLGFTLKEVKELMEIHESAKSITASGRFRSKEWEKAFNIARERLDLIDQKIQFLKVLKKPLAAVLDQTDPQERDDMPSFAVGMPCFRANSQMHPHKHSPLFSS
jgi:MerR family mercuric resistance operon transcriptional regulator